jgi:hypothetical protein
MIGWAVVLAALTFVVAGALAAEPPTRTGDVIGTVFMRPDLSLSIRLRSVECDGTLAEGILDLKPGELIYEVVIDHVGGLQPNETKAVPAWPTRPCPSN